MTRRGAPARARAPQDPYGIGPVSGYIGPVVGVIVLVVIAALTVSLFNGQIPVPNTTPNGGGGQGDGGTTPSAAPSNEVIVVPTSLFPGTIVYAKAGNIWSQTTDKAIQLTDSGNDAMPSFSVDGKWIYFIRIERTGGVFPTAGSYYNLDTPVLFRMRPDGKGAKRLLTGRFTQGSYKWFYWLRQPVPSPDGKTVTVISDGPDPLQSDIVLHTFGLGSKKLTSLNLPESLHLGHQDPAWRPDGRYLLYVKNGRDGTRGAPQVYRYDPISKKTKALTGPGYITPTYSPDGRWIAATQTDAFGTDIAILDQAGTDVLRVTDDGHSFSPVWSPAGDAVAFLHLAGTIVDLRMARLDDATRRWVVTDTVDLTKVSGLDGASRPSWFVPPADNPAPSGAPGSGGSPGASSAP